MSLTKFGGAWLVIALATALIFVVSGPTLAASPVEEFQAKLSRWDAEEAYAQLQPLLKQDPQNPELLEAAAYIAFYRGDYGEALAKIREALARGPAEERKQSFQLFIQQTYDVIRPYKLYQSDHFELRLDEKRDGILAGYILDALEKTYQVMGKQFSFHPKEKVRVEVFPDSQSFYYVSSLSVRDIEVSGAVGLAKFNKVMLLSPRGLVHGYRFLDAVSHEYLHYVIVKLSGNKAPIWFHEGLAKFEEAKWRTPESMYLNPLNQTLLSRAERNGAFVGFAQMEPSLVKLETPEQVQLAYAEAASAIDFIVNRVGYPGLTRIMKVMAESEEEGARGAVEKVMQISFADFEKSWKAFLTAKELKEVEGVEARPLKVKEKSGDEERLDLKEIKSIQARNWVLLGDMLRDRRRPNAAVIEYRKAINESPYSVSVLNKLAGALGLVGKDEEALGYLKKAIGLAPDHPTAYLNLGASFLRLKKYEDAKGAFNEALQVNPFDPRVHEGLSRAYQALGDEKGAAKEKEIIQQLLPNR